MAEDLKIKVQAQLANAEQFEKQIREAAAKGVKINQSELQKGSNRLNTAKIALNNGDLKGAIDMTVKAFETLTNLVSRAVAAIDPAAGKLEAGILNAQKNYKNKLAQLEKLEGSYAISKGRGPANEGAMVYRRWAAVSDADKKAILNTGWLKDKNGNALTSLKGSRTPVIAKRLAESANQQVDDKLVKSIDEIRPVLDKLLTALGYQASYANGRVTGIVPYAKNDPFLGMGTEAVQKYEVAHAKYLSAANQAQTQLEQKKQEYSLAISDLKTNSMQADTINQQISELNVSGLQQTENARDIQRDVRQDIYDKQRAEDETITFPSLTTNSINEGTQAIEKQTTTVGRAVTTFFGYQMVLRQIRQLWNEAIRTVTELDKQLTDQAIVTNLTREETWGLVESYQELANATGLTQTEIAAVTTEYLKQGETIEDALTLTKAASEAATVAGISAQQSIEYLTTAIHGFNLEAEDALSVSDKFAVLAAQSATDYDELAIALSKVASQASLAGMSMDYTLALLTTGLDITQEAPESIGTALKTIIARMREISSYGETLEDGANINDVEEALGVVGINLRDVNGELRNTEDVLDELGRKWEDLNANQQAAAARALAGTRQQSRLIAILDNYEDVLDYQAASEASVGATTAQQAKYLQGMEAATNRLQNAFQTLITTVVNSDTLTFFVNGIADFLQSLKNFLNPATIFAIVAKISSMLVSSGSFIDKIKATLQQILGIVRQTDSIMTGLTTKGNSLNKSVAYTPWTWGRGGLKTAVNNWNNRNVSPAGVLRGHFGADGWIFNKVKNSSSSNKFARFIDHMAYGGAASADRDSILQQSLLSDFGDKYKGAIQQVFAQSNKQLTDVLNSSLLTEQQKYAYLQRQVELERIKTELSSNDLSDAKKEQLLAKQAEYQAQQDATLPTKGQKLQYNIGKVASIVSGVSGAIGLVTGWVQQIDSAIANSVQDILNEGNKIEAEIYENANSASTLRSLIDDFQELDKKVVKTADDLDDLEEVRDQLINTLKIASNVAANISTQELVNQAENEANRLDAENQKKIAELQETLTGVQAVWNWQAPVGGAAAGAAIGSVFGPIGTAVGAALGLVGGGIAWIAEAVQANDRQKRINELLDSEGGEDMLKQAILYGYDNKAFASGGLADTKRAEAIESSFNALISGLDEASLKNLLESFNYDIQAATDSLVAALNGSADSLVTLNDENATYGEKIKAAQNIYAAAMSSGNEAIQKAIYENYALFIDLGKILGNSVHWIDDLNWNISDLNDTMTVLRANGYGDAEVQSIIDQWGEAVSNGDIDELQRMGEKYGYAFWEAANNLIASSNLSDATATFTSTSSKVANLRETQAKWGTMTPQEQLQFFQDNQAFFSQAGAFEAFTQGKDITSYIQNYVQDTQQSLVDDLNNIKTSLESQIRYQQEILNDPESTEQDREDAQKQIESLSNELKFVEEQMNNLPNIAKLSVDAVIDYQSQQIELLQDMYQQEEDDLIDSLNRRKEAYQKYYDAINESYDLEEYTKERDQLIASISALSGGTDATSRNKVNDLYQELTKLQEEQMKTNRENAQQKVLENIDNQVSQIEGYFEKFLGSNSELLKSLNANTFGNYINYLRNNGATAEEIKQAEGQYQVLLSGLWTENGLVNFDGTPTIDIDTAELVPNEVENPSDTEKKEGEGDESNVFSDGDIEKLATAFSDAAKETLQSALTVNTKTLDLDNDRELKKIADSLISYMKKYGYISIG